MSVFRGSPSKVPLPGLAVQVAAGSHHTVVLLANGQVFTFGNFQVCSFEPEWYINEFAKNEQILNILCVYRFYSVGHLICNPCRIFLCSVKQQFNKKYFANFWCYNTFSDIKHRK